MNDIITGHDLKVFTPKVFPDDRGYFFETFNQKRFEQEVGKAYNWVQENESKSCMGVLRGLHYQKGGHAQTKLVRVISGAVIDFVLDYDPGSPSYGKMSFVLLTGENKKQFLVPNHYAHGFLSLADDTIFAYKCDNYYNRESEAGFNIFDRKLDIIHQLELGIPPEIPGITDVTEIIDMVSAGTFILSEKDLQHPNF